MAPALLLITAFLVVPALWTLVLGVTNYRLTGSAARNPRFVGLDNYATALADEGFRGALWRTLVFTIGSGVIGQAVLGFLLAWTTRLAARWVRDLVQALTVLAWILPSSIVAFLWVSFLFPGTGTWAAISGDHQTNWLISDPMVSIIIYNTWRGTAFSMLLFSGALASVPPNLLESAQLAGAKGWQLFRDVVFPHIRPQLLTDVLLVSMWTFNDFGPYLLTAGGPNHATETLPVFVYLRALYGGEFGYGSAISVIMLLLNLLLSLVYLLALRRGGKNAR